VSKKNRPAFWVSSVLSQTAGKRGPLLADCHRLFYEALPQIERRPATRTRWHFAGDATLEIAARRQTGAVADCVGLLESNRISIHPPVLPLFSLRLRRLSAPIRFSSITPTLRRWVSVQKRRGAASRASKVSRSSNLFWNFRSPRSQREIQGFEGTAPLSRTFCRCSNGPTSMSFVEKSIRRSGYSPSFFWGLPPANPQLKRRRLDTSFVPTQSIKTRWLVVSSSDTTSLRTQRPHLTWNRDAAPLLVFA